METGGRAFVAVDVPYLGSGDARAAAVVATDARFCEVVAERPEVVAEALPYRPGEFYLRELPPIRAVLSGLGLLVVDGYADLNPGGRPGLGAHAHAEFGIPVMAWRRPRSTRLPMPSRCCAEPRRKISLSGRSSGKRRL
jgi:deoxyribonuclease V